MDRKPYWVDMDLIIFRFAMDFSKAQLFRCRINEFQIFEKRNEEINEEKIFAVKDAP